MRPGHRLFALLFAGLLVRPVNGVAADVAQQPLKVAGAVTHERLLQAEAHPEQWLAHGGDYRNQQFSGLKQIDTGTVAGLKLAWFADMDTNRGVEATPVVVDGVLYVTGSWSHLYAIDAKTGAVRWSFDPHVPGKSAPNGCCDVVSRGVAVWEGKVLLATFDGRLMALDANTGKVVWRVDTIVDHAMPYTISGAPLLANGAVVIGNGGAEFGVRGYVTAYDIATGKKLWRFYTVPGDPKKPFESAAMKMAATTWKGEWWKYGGGGTVWDSMAYDPALDLIYLGVGNGGPWDQSFRSPGGGDNLFLSSIVAVRRKTGEYVWHYQETPGDSWDYTATQHIMLLDLVIDGKLRKTLVQAPKNGLFYVLDRVTGKLISAKNYVPVNWMTGIDAVTGRPQFTPGLHYQDKAASVLPGPTGAHNWQPMAWSPQTRLVYIPALELGAATFSRDRNFVFKPGFINVGVDARNFLYPEDPKTIDETAAQLKGHLIAWDPIAQREAWRVTHRAPWNGGALATAGGLVFQGTPDGRLLALDAKDGKQLWQYDCQSGVMAAPVSYMIDGEQYIAVAVGWGSHYGVEWGEFSKRATGGRPNISRVVAFKLNGTATLPPGYKLAAQSPPAIPIPASHTPAMVDRGRLLYTENCNGCHGGAAISGGVLPDLRNASPFVHEHWQDIVLKGMLENAGMRNFSDRLGAEDAEDIRAYVLYRAYQTWAQAHPGASGTEPSAAPHQSYAIAVSAETREQVQKFLDDISAAFDQGDLGAMMESYDASEDVTYVYEGKVFRGQKAIRQDYADKFFASTSKPSQRPQDARLKLTLVHLDAVAPDVVIATARVTLGDPGTIKKDDASLTTLVISRASGRWRVIYDHSS